MFLDRAGAGIGNFLSFLSKRQTAIASNIANADTPGYKTLDVRQPASFSEIMNGLLPATEEAPGLAARNDGNNVNLDREARLLAENAMKFNLAAQMLRGELKGIRAAIEEGRLS